MKKEKETSEKAYFDNLIDHSAATAGNSALSPVESILKSLHYFLSCVCVFFTCFGPQQIGYCCCKLTHKAVCCCVCMWNSLWLASVDHLRESLAAHERYYRVSKKWSCHQCLSVYIMTHGSFMSIMCSFKIYYCYIDRKVLVYNVVHLQICHTELM